MHDSRDSSWYMARHHQHAVMGAFRLRFKPCNIASDADIASLLLRHTWLSQVVDGFNGLPEHAPYDVIHVGAAAAGA